MLKKKLNNKNIFAVMITMICLCVMLASCTSMTAMEKAYKKWLKDAGESVKSVTTVMDVGVYSDCDVAIMRFDYTDDMEGLPAEEDCYVNDVYVCTLGSSQYNLIAYTPDEEIKELEDAYNDGDITGEDLDSIIEVLDAAGYRKDYSDDDDGDE